MAESKYGYLMKNLDLRDTQRKSGGNADHIAGFGGKDLEGLNLNFTWAIHTGLGDWHDGRDPHVHPYDEVPERVIFWWILGSRLLFAGRF